MAAVPAGKKSPLLSLHFRSRRMEKCPLQWVCNLSPKPGSTRKFCVFSSWQPPPGPQVPYLLSLPHWASPSSLQGGLGLYSRGLNTSLATLCAGSSRHPVVPVSAHRCHTTSDFCIPRFFHSLSLSSYPHQPWPVQPFFLPPSCLMLVPSTFVVSCIRRTLQILPGQT